jgi:peptidoglycan/xylan/chitin deacetylase (PgdA/CDA1 family)
VALFHCVHRTRADARSHGVASVTTDDLRRFLDAVLRAGYAPTRGEDIGNCTHRKQVHLTFDDGYFNNTWALPVLAEFRVPATFFICTSNVLSGEAFWWDVASRRLAAAGKSRLETKVRSGASRNFRHPLCRAGCAANSATA